MTPKLYLSKSALKYSDHELSEMILRLEGISKTTDIARISELTDIYKGRIIRRPDRILQFIRTAKKPFFVFLTCLN